MNHFLAVRFFCNPRVGVLSETRALFEDNWTVLMYWLECKCSVGCSRVANNTSTKRCVVKQLKYSLQEQQ